MASSKVSAETAINMVFISSINKSSESSDSSEDYVSRIYIKLIRNNAYIYIYIYIYINSQNKFFNIFINCILKNCLFPEL